MQERDKIASIVRQSIEGMLPLYMTDEIVLRVVDAFMFRGAIFSSRKEVEKEEGK